MGIIVGVRSPDPLADLGASEFCQSTSFNGDLTFLVEGFDAAFFGVDLALVVGEWFGISGAVGLFPEGEETDVNRWPQMGR